MVTKAQPKTRQQKLDERRAELDWMAQMQAAHEAERAERQREHNEFMQRVQARRDAIDTHIRRSWAQRSDVPMSEREFAAARAQIEQEAFEQVKATRPSGLGNYYQQKRAEELAAAEEAERQRIAAMSPKEVWLSTLSRAERQHIAKWEQINHQDWPYAPV